MARDLNLIATVRRRLEPGLGIDYRPTDNVICLLELALSNARTFLKRGVCVSVEHLQELWIMDDARRVAFVGGPAMREHIWIAWSCTWESS